MKARFLHTSMAGSYYEDCEILRYEKFDVLQHGSDLAKVMIALEKTVPEDHRWYGLDGAVIRYADDICGEPVNCEVWVPLDRLEFIDEV